MGQVRVTRVNVVAVRNAPSVAGSGLRITFDEGGSCFSKQAKQRLMLLSRKPL